MGNISSTIQNLVSIFRDTASAIRTKDGTGLPVSPFDFASRILAIPSGSGTGDEYAK